MTIASFKPTAKKSSEPNIPKVQSDNYKGVVVDDKYQTLHSLAAFVEGLPLTVNYYGQILGENNNPREIDPAQSRVYQQYTKVIGLDIRVQDDLTQAFNDESQLSQITGSANVYADITPNTWDYLTFKTTRGMTGLFRITNVTRLSMQRDSVHRIEYQMVGYADLDEQAKSFLANLEDKVTRRFYFHGDRLIEGVSPLLKEEEHHFVENLYREYEKIVTYYVETFHNRTYQTLVLPGQPQAVYDKFVVDFLMSIISVRDNSKVAYIKKLGSDNDRYMLQPHFWKAIFERNSLYIYQANKFMGLVNRQMFNRNHYVAGAGMSTIDQYVYPLQIDPSVKLPADEDPKYAFMGGITDTTGPGGSVCSVGNNSYTDDTGVTVPLYKRLLVDSYYVLSSSFYNQTDTQCLLEKVTWDYLEGKAIQLKELYALIRQFYSLARLEQFYYAPLLLTFIRDTRTTQYS